MQARATPERAAPQTNNRLSPWQTHTTGWAAPSDPPASRSTPAPESKHTMKETAQEAVGLGVTSIQSARCAQQSERPRSIPAPKNGHTFE